MKTESNRRDRTIRAMPAIGFALTMLFVSVQSANAQWNPSPSPSPNTNIYYNAGNVGIGTTSPAQALDVVGAANVSLAVQVNRTGSDAAGSGPYYALFHGVPVTRGWITQLSASNNFDFWYYNGSAFGRKVTIDTSGNVGIGTTSPGTMLDVASTISSWTGGTNPASTGAVHGLSMGYDNNAEYGWIQALRE